MTAKNENEEKAEKPKLEIFCTNIDENNLNSKKSKIYLDKSTTPILGYTELQLDDSKETCSISNNVRPQGLCGRIKTVLNSRPLFFFTVVFLSLSLAFLLTSLMAIGPVKAEKDAIFTSYNESKMLHNSCKSSYEIIADKFNRTAHELVESQNENAYLQEIVVLKTKEVEHHEMTISDLNKLNSAQNREMIDLKTLILLKDTNITNLTNSIETQKKQMAHLQDVIEAKVKFISDLQEINLNQKNELSEIRKVYLALMEKLSKLQNSSLAKEIELLELQKSHFQKDIDLSKLQDSILSKNNELQELELDNNIEISTLKDSLSIKNNEISEGDVVKVKTISTWGFLVSLFSGANNATSSYNLIILSMSLIILRLFKY